MYGLQEIGISGLTVKQRPHFTNIYAPFCPDCGLPFESKKALETHLAMAHAKRSVHYQLRKNQKALRGVSRPINLEYLVQKGCEPDELKAWLKGMKRVRRIAKIGHTDLILVEPVRRKPPSAKRLYSMCLRVVLCGLEPTLTTAPKRMRRVRDHVSQHFNLVLRIREQRRYARLRTPEARARLLAIGLANPEASLTYAERANASPREFRKANRATWYDRNE
jgi:hypothetical protein